MQEPSSNDLNELRDLEHLQSALARRLVFPNRSIEFPTLDSNELDRAAETLIRKRISQTRSLLPASCKLLGNEYRRLFREYAQSHHFDGYRAILLDADGFATWIRMELSKDRLRELDCSQLQDALRWEQELCRARLSRFRFRFMRIGNQWRLILRIGARLRIWSL